ncbi:hypothetical membrane associated protein [Brucella melitensis bv. 1 str. 16M]|uniref:Hypothetical membrane associated protein n=1 Tax=Brucella melitensis biotype 1 (strain ATCC 23456 / CCUG 17765 / NCTC 10094 / 16M) TaxID=224914 RepID=Q8YGC5_BRUME|nr:hypothetical membrane associated protein [Brucella melitensis bv. 1 str. 16M]
MLKIRFCQPWRTGNKKRRLKRRFAKRQTDRLLISGFAVTGSFAGSLPLLLLVCFTCFNRIAEFGPLTFMTAI